jgi:hypothetical protein
MLVRDFYLIFTDKKNDCSYRLVVRTLPFHGSNTGSSPVKNRINVLHILLKRFQIIALFLLKIFCLEVNKKNILFKCFRNNMDFCIYNRFFNTINFFLSHYYFLGAKMTD